MRLVTQSNLDLPFVILNLDIANEPRAHRIFCSYASDRNKPDRMQADSKRQNRTGSHWLMLVTDIDQVDATRNCKCWEEQ